MFYTLTWFHFTLWHKSILHFDVFSFYTLTSGNFRKWFFRQMHLHYTNQICFFVHKPTQSGISIMALHSLNAIYSNLQSEIARPINDVSNFVLYWHYWLCILGMQPRYYKNTKFVRFKLIMPSKLWSIKVVKCSPFVIRHSKFVILNSSF